MKWIARVLGPVLSLGLGLATIPLVIISRFGGSLLGFAGLVTVLLLIGAAVGYTFTKLGAGSLRRSMFMGILYSASGLLLLSEFGGPAIMLPVIPLTFTSVVLGGRHALKDRNRDAPADSETAKAGWP